MTSLRPFLAEPQTRLRTLGGRRLGRHSLLSPTPEYGGTKSAEGGPAGRAGRTLQVPIAQNAGLWRNWNRVARSKPMCYKRDLTEISRQDRDSKCR